VIKLIIPGKPMGKQRPRVLKSGVSYTPKETVNYETLIKQLYITNHFRKQLEGPIKVTIYAYMPIPKSASKKKKEEMRAGKIRPTVRPDWDNIGKMMDALNTIAFDDDKQIVDGRVIKLYSDEPRLEIHLEEII